jgi:SAM-dependent methyltransferase
LNQSTHYPESVRRWLTTPLGEALVQQESRVVEEAFDGIFGEQCLQLGLWGEANTFLRHARTQRKALIHDGSVGTALVEPGSVGASSVDPGSVGAASAATDGHTVIGQLHRLPIQNDSVDCVLLPHVLDFSDRSHAILREADRVLTSHGHLAILGFKTGGLWGVRRMIPGAGLPPDANNLLPERRLRDWLQLLDLHIHGVTRFFFRWPLPGNRGTSSPKWEQRGQRWWPEFAACYMLTAQKRVSTLTPVRPLWRRNPKVVAGLAETSNRVSRIRFDQKH